MKNKSTMLLVGIGLAYLLYRLYAKKSMAPVLKNGVPKLLNTIETFNSTDQLDNRYLVDTINTAELVDTPATYQTLYGRTNVRINGSTSRVPATC